MAETEAEPPALSLPAAIQMSCQKSLRQSLCDVRGCSVPRWC